MFWRREEIGEKLRKPGVCARGSLGFSAGRDLFLADQEKGGGGIPLCLLAALFF